MKRLTLGLAAYGRHFALRNNNDHFYNAPCKKGDDDTYAGRPGTYLYDKKYILSYYEICEKLSSFGWKREWINDYDIYAYGESEWVGYDDQESLWTKVELAKTNNLAGLAWRSLDLDDFTGQFCGQGTYPLIRESLLAWAGTTTSSTTTRTTASTTES